MNKRNLSDVEIARNQKSILRQKSVERSEKNAVLVDIPNSDRLSLNKVAILAEPGVR
ncbi:hypothetical protein [Nostoc sp. LPT]|uniref:hypothetical protein n=1 Tax=Nostoc sp. LPT TaxID=2815387 RepID=UPI001D695FB1|nr:hypothetical protein [Nostoc sp. LPT]MBN4006113.1 hypothetical protein [Nostoc sp. LPT]